jgi:hypothetical protein
MRKSRMKEILLANRKRVLLKKYGNEFTKNIIIETREDLKS